jgi:hypothetical protein
VIERRGKNIYNRHQRKRDKMFWEEKQRKKRVEREEDRGDKRDTFSHTPLGCINDRQAGPQHEPSQMPVGRWKV